MTGVRNERLSKTIAEDEQKKQVQKRQRTMGENGDEEHKIDEEDS
jgi:hypothetical protein